MRSGKPNEQKLFATATLAAAMASQGAAHTAALLATEKAERTLSVAHSAALVDALAAGSAAAFLQEGTAADKVEHAVTAAGTSGWDCLGGHEAASGVVGPGSTASIAGRALGAFVTGQGSCTDRLAHAAHAAGEGALVQATGMVLAKSGVPLCPMGLGLMKEGMKDEREFAGGSSLSVGYRDPFGEAQA